MSAVSWKVARRRRGSNEMVARSCFLAVRRVEVEVGFCFLTVRAVEVEAETEGGEEGRGGRRVLLPCGTHGDAGCCPPPLALHKRTPLPTQAIPEQRPRRPTAGPFATTLPTMPAGSPPPRLGHLETAAVAATVRLPPLPILGSDLCMSLAVYIQLWYTSMN